MAAGYGFGAEGTRETAALVRAMKVMSYGLDGGTSFMEDYTYHLAKGNMKALGAHMIERFANQLPQASLDWKSTRCPLGVKEDPPRLVFNVPAGRGLNASPD